MTGVSLVTENLLTNLQVFQYCPKTACHRFQISTTSSISEAIYTFIICTGMDMHSCMVECADQGSNNNGHY